MGQKYVSVLLQPPDDRPGVDRLRDLILTDPRVARSGVIVIRLHRADHDAMGGPARLWFPSGAWVPVRSTGHRLGRVTYERRTRDAVPLTDGWPALDGRPTAGVAPKKGPSENAPPATPPGKSVGPAGKTAPRAHGVRGARSASRLDDLFARPPTDRQWAAVLAVFRDWPVIPTRVELVARLGDVGTPSAATKRLRNVRRRVRPEYLPLWDVTVRRPTGGRHGWRLRPVPLSDVAWMA